MNMRVDESRQKKAVAQIHRWNVRMRVAKPRIIAAAGHAAFEDQQAAILVTLQRARILKRIARRVKQGRAKQFAPRRGDHCPDASFISVPTGLGSDSCSPSSLDRKKNTLRRSRTLEQNGPARAERRDRIAQSFAD